MLNGRYGPYITDKQRNAKIPKDKDPKSFTLEQCQAALAAAPVRTFGKWGRKKAGAQKAAPTKAAATAKVKTKPEPARLAAKGSKAAVDKKSPEKIGEPTAKSKAPAKAKAKPAAKKKSSAKKKS